MGSWKNRSMFQSVALTYLTIQLSNKLIPLGPILKNMLHQMVGVKLSWIGCGSLWLLSDGCCCGPLVVAAATSRIFNAISYHKSPMPCYLKRDKLFLACSDRYHSSEWNSSLVPKGLSLFEFETWPLINSQLKNKMCLYSKAR